MEPSLHPELENAEQILGLDLAHLRHAADFSSIAQEDARTNLSGYLEDTEGTDHLDVLAFGSLAREEATSQSDFDYLVVAHDIAGASPRVSRRVREAVEETRMDLKMGEPGTSGLFGRVVPAHQLIEQIGLEEDTNLTHTRRILVLEESVSLSPEAARRDELVYSILERYLLDYEEHGYEARVPRFLLNDVLRYWYTVAIDYQAKRWDELDIEGAGERLKWGVRYIKLRTSRKWTYVGSVISLFMPVIIGQDATPDLLREQFGMPALARAAQLCKVFESEETLGALRGLLEVADQFVGWLDDEDWREEIRSVRQPRQAFNDGEPDTFVEAYQQARRLEQSLRSLMLSEEPCPGDADSSLRTLSERYLLF